MTRCIIIQGDLEIAYGDDDVLGYFFSVADHRVYWKADGSKEVNSVAESISADGGGVFLSLTTGLGIGRRVSAATMAAYMKRYGIPNSQIEKMLRGQPVNALPAKKYKLVQEI